MRDVRRCRGPGCRKLLSLATHGSAKYCNGCRHKAILATKRKTWHKRKHYYEREDG